MNYINIIAEKLINDVWTKVDGDKFDKVQIWEPNVVDAIDYCADYFRETDLPVLSQDAESTVWENNESIMILNKEDVEWLEKRLQDEIDDLEDDEVTSDFYEEASNFMDTIEKMKNSEADRFIFYFN